NRNKFLLSQNSAEFFCSVTHSEELEISFYDHGLAGVPTNGQIASRRLCPVMVLVISMQKGNERPCINEQCHRRDPRDTYRCYSGPKDRPSESQLDHREYRGPRSAVDPVPAVLELLGQA